MKTTKLDVLNKLSDIEYYVRGTSYSSCSQTLQDTIMEMLEDVRAKIQLIKE